LLPLLDSDLRVSVGGKDLPEDIKTRLMALREENTALKEKSRTDKQMLAKARSVCVILRFLRVHCIVIILVL
jgi:hypothetical protein